MIVAALTAAGDGRRAGPAEASPTDTRAPQIYDTGRTYYRVCNVRPDDPDGGLNVRELAGVTQSGRFHEVAGVIPHDGREVKYLGQRHLVKGVAWYQVRWRSVSGWVSAIYLCPNTDP